MENKEIQEKEKKEIQEIGKAILIWLATIIGVGFLIAYPISWLWNYLMPGLFGSPMITPLNAWGLAILMRLVFSVKGV